jgi:hypothetical protein
VRFEDNICGSACTRTNRLHGLAVQKPRAFRTKAHARNEIVFLPPANAAKKQNVTGSLTTFSYAILSKALRGDADLSRTPLELILFVLAPKRQRERRGEGKWFKFNVYGWSFRA